MRNRVAARTCVLVLMAAGLSATAGAVQATAESASTMAEGGRFVTTWDTSVDRRVELHLYDEVDVDIDWGDGTTQDVAGFRDPRPAPPVVHRYTDGMPTHQVVVTGTFDRLGGDPYDYDTDPVGLLSVDEWGATGTTDATAAFAHSQLLTHVAEVPAGLTNMAFMFEFSAFNGPVRDWDVSAVTDMTHMFSASNFNQPVDTWDVSNVTTMFGMFLCVRLQPAGRDLGRLQRHGHGLDVLRRVRFQPTTQLVGRLPSH